MTEIIVVGAMMMVFVFLLSGGKNGRRSNDDGIKDAMEVGMGYFGGIILVVLIASVLLVSGLIAR